MYTKTFIRTIRNLIVSSELGPLVALRRQNGGLWREKNLPGKVRPELRPRKRGHRIVSDNTSCLEITVGIPSPPQTPTIVTSHDVLFRNYLTSKDTEFLRYGKELSPVKNDSALEDEVEDEYWGKKRRSWKKIKRRKEERSREYVESGRRVRQLLVRNCRTIKVYVCVLRKGQRRNENPPGTLFTSPRPRVERVGF